jgi:hypothetical protein
VAQTDDLAVDVVDDEVDPVPAAGSGLGAIGHGPAGRAGRPGEQQAEVPALDVGEGRTGPRDHLEVENGRVEVDRLVDVVDHVADADHLIV